VLDACACARTLSGGSADPRRALWATRWARSRTTPRAWRVMRATAAAGPAGAAAGLAAAGAGTGEAAAGGAVTRGAVGDAAAPMAGAAGLPSEVAAAAAAAAAPAGAAAAREARGAAAAGAPAIEGAAAAGAAAVEGAAAAAGVPDKALSVPCGAISHVCCPSCCCCCVQNKPGRESCMMLYRQALRSLCHLKRQQPTSGISTSIPTHTGNHIARTDHIASTPTGHPARVKP